MDAQKQQLIERLQSATNILVTVSSNPSVDQLAACIGLTVALNKLDKHATAVFSGDVPSTIEFLKPEETIEKNTNSLQDFIIALDKSKADKLRYKVEDKVVKIFITPYRTSLSEDDLEFSQGDFNVDVVLALGVHEQNDLDQAITSHGRILHDATVASVTNTSEPGLGTINWQDTQASSLSELVAELVKDLGKDLLDEQIATALLTGIVAATDRFRNEHTSANTMNISADLMSAGANQQLVTSQLEKELVVPKSSDEDKQDSDHNDDNTDQAAKSEDGTLEIDHDSDEETADKEPQPEEKPPTDTQNDREDVPNMELPAPAEPDLPQIEDVHGGSNATKPPTEFEPYVKDSDRIFQPPPVDPTMTANSTVDSDEADSTLDTLGLAPKGPLLSHDHTVEDEKKDSSEAEAPAESAQAESPSLPEQSSTADTSTDTEKASNQSAPAEQTTEEPSTPPLESNPSPATPSPSGPSDTPSPAPWTPPMPPKAEEASPAPSAAPPDVANPFAPPPPGGSFNAPPAPVTPQFTPPAAPTATPTSPFGQPQAAPDAPLGIVTGTGGTEEAAAAEDVDTAREEVMRALSEQPNETLPPIKALNAAPLGPELHGPFAATSAPLGPLPASPAPSPASTIPGFTPPPSSVPNAPLATGQPMNMPLPSTPNFAVPPPQVSPPTNSPAGSPTLPAPTVPPPFLPGTSPGQNSQ